MTYQSHAGKIENMKIINPETVDRIGKEGKTNIEDRGACGAEATIS